MRVSKPLRLWSGDSLIERVRADTLSENVPDDMIVDINFSDERYECMALYAEVSNSRSSSAYNLRFLIEAKCRLTVRSGTVEGGLPVSVLAPCQSGLGSKIWRLLEEALCHRLCPNSVTDQLPRVL